MKNLLLILSLTSLVSFGQVKQTAPPIIKSPFQTKTVRATKTIITPSSNSLTNQKKSTKKIKTVNGSFMINFASQSNLAAKGLNAKGTHQKLSHQFNEWFALNEKHTFQLVSENTDRLNTTHYAYKQQYSGYNIYGGAVLMHYKEGSVYAVNGKIAEFDSIDTTITVTEAQALSEAKKYKKVTEIIKEYPIEKVIYKTASENEIAYTLVYQVRIDSYKPFVMANVFVDAKTGEIINDITLIAHADTPATANTLYSGVQTITTDLTDGVYTLKDNARNIETYDAFGINFSSLFSTQDGFPDANLYSNTSTTWSGVPKLKSFFINELSPNWWQEYLIVDNKPDIYIKIKDALNNVVFNSFDNRSNNFLPTTAEPLIIPVGVYLTNPPYTYEVWDYDFAGSDDFGFSGDIQINDGISIWSEGNNSGMYILDTNAPNPALDVHWGMGVTYDYFLNTFGLDSYDGNGSVIRSYINFNNTFLQEIRKSQNDTWAIMSFNIMMFGLGDGIDNNPVVGLDVEGHEYSHLVISTINDSPSGLDYNGESGALNESFADIFGTCIEFYSGVNPDWLIGEDVVINGAMRSMSNPIEYEDPDTYGKGVWQPIDDPSDYGGVHTNSGVQNYWFYLLSEGGSGTNDRGNAYSVTGIGIDKAARIAYRNLTRHLPTRTSNYYDSYLGSLLAAESLRDENVISSQEYNSVRQAWYAVGIGNDPDEQCSGVTNLIAETGAFSDGSGNANYSDNANCKWVIAPTGATQITLNFTEFDTETDFDYVTVYDGPDENFPVLATWWGNTLPSTITSTNGTGAMCVIFTSDDSLNYSGWSANYTATVVPPSCSGLTTLTDADGAFGDGSGSDNYINNQQCAWYIAPPCASSVTLSFTEFDTELNYDGIIVYDDFYGTNILATYSGNTIPASITSSTGEMLVAFVSDFSTSLDGFEATYTSTGTTSYSAANTVLNTLDYGEISDGSGASEYCNNTNSSWLIQPPQATSITIRFTEFDLENASSDGNAIYDYVIVYDGVDASAPILGVFLGSSIPSNVTSTGGSMYISFYSDFSATFQGWEAIYTSTQSAVCNGSTLTSDSGTLSDGSGTENYSNNSECSWLIQPTSGNVINLTFTEFDTELNYDGVIVYDGADETATVLGVFSGSTLPEVITSTGNNMYVLFVSDESLRMNGWSATYDTSSLSVKDETILETFNLYPNPTNSIVNFDNSQTNFETLEIHNVLGQSLLKVHLDNSNQTNINISKFNSGVYTFKFRKKGMFKTVKVIKN
jgi:Zn-dependent metalloprotease